jgi:hypothetical protein
MGNQEILDYAVMLAREEDLETLEKALIDPDIDSLNGLVKNFKRQVLLSTDEVFELTRVEDGTFLYLRGHHREDEVVFGYFRGFAATDTKYISEDADEILIQSSVGFMLKKFFTDNEYYMVPVENIDKVLDVNENFDKIQYADEIAEILSEENIDILRLAKLVRNLKCEDEELALVKAYLQSSVLPSQLCDYVIAPGIVESGQFKIPTVQYATT